VRGIVRSSVALIILSLMLFGTSTAFAQGHPVSTEKVAGILRNDLSFFEGYLGVREKVFSTMADQEERAARAFVTVLNNTPGSFAVTEDMNMDIDWDVLWGAEPCDLWSVEDLMNVRAIAGRLDGAKVYGPSGDASIRAVWYEHQLLTSSSNNDHHDVRVSSTRWRHPTTMSIGVQVTYKASVSGGVTVPAVTLLAWLQLEGTWSITMYEYGSYALKDPGDPASHFYPVGEVGEWWYTDYHFHSSATYYQWYCTDEDVVGEVTRIFQGTYTATGFECETGSREYWPKLYACTCDLCQP